MEEKIKELESLIDAQTLALKKDTSGMTTVERVQNALQIHGIEQYLKGLREALRILKK